jgi:FAD/FMN-containing dehydrogenase
MTLAQAPAPFVAANFLQSLTDLGIRFIADPQETLPYRTDYRKRIIGDAIAVALPANTEEVAQLVKLCQQYAVCIVPQGGNTGLVGGSVPDNSAHQTRASLIISLKRMNRVRGIDPANLTLTVEAGCTLQEVQDAARQAGFLFPLSLASQGSCTIGGNLSSNAGGVQVLRYGNARELCLGLEAVMPDAAIFSALRGLRKDNTGYAIKDLLIGAEGTLGIITAATLKLYPLPSSQVVALAALNSVEEAVELLGMAQKSLDSSLTGFELMAQICLDLVAKHFKEHSPLEQACPYYVLMECSDMKSDQETRARLEQFLETAFERGLIQDASIANSLSQNQALWRLRELVSEAQSAEGMNIKHDISLAVSHIPAFVRKNEEKLSTHFPGMRLVNFGHLGDGNLHYNISPPVGQAHEDFMQHQAAVNRLVYDDVHSYGGSISAEHGLGRLKVDEITHYKSSVDLQIMARIKRALDPHHLFNPGKLIRPERH